ncbi:type II toxin-antitoxin system PemK/MazF family toxin, partial [Caballeronia sp. GAFFF1]|uniref:type II toxin-antitoxin system PemK/MazF family toxin n=1 Tax=Caballeronia sp. GAFFF1 TaxID=2921779 RepID=UPI0032EF8FEE
MLMCDFSRGFVPPEMVKKRAVVVISRSETHGRRLCTVVPLSTTAPAPALAWHVLLTQNPLPGT